MEALEHIRTHNRHELSILLSAQTFVKNSQTQRDATRERTLHTSAITQPHRSGVDFVIDDRESLRKHQKCASRSASNAKQCT